MEVSRAVRRLSTSRVGIGYSVITPVAGSTRISRSLRQSNAVMVLGVRAGLVEGREENKGECSVMRRERISNLPIFPPSHSPNQRYESPSN